MDESRHEYPISFIWYTKHAGKTIEWIMDHDPSYFVWMLKTFQDVTPPQADHFYSRYKKRIPKQYIQDVEPYTYQKGDPEEMYMELCTNRDLKPLMEKDDVSQKTIETEATELKLLWHKPKFELNPAMFK